MSARLRLTLSYAGFLMLAGGALIALLFYILRFVPTSTISGEGAYIPNRNDLIEALLPRTWQVLLVLLAVGLLGGWLIAGRMLRPLRRINAVARTVAAGSLDERVRLDGTKDEFRELADTFDSMLDRLQASFDEKSRFAANAAHELRTPYAIERSMLDVAIADPAGIDVEQLVSRLDETNRRGIEVVEALLALASIEDGRTPIFAPVDVAEIVAGVLRDLRPLADSAGVAVTSELGEGDIDGSPTLIRQLVSNLVLNAVRHNLDVDGRVYVRTETDANGSVEFTIANTGAVVSDELLGSMTEPFVRGVARVTARPEGTRAGHEGSGLGLALVTRVAHVHGAKLLLTALEAGGMRVRVSFAAPGDGGAGHPYIADISK